MAPSCASPKVILQSPMPPEGDLQDNLGIKIKLWPRETIVISQCPLQCLKYKLKLNLEHKYKILSSHERSGCCKTN